MGEAGLAPVAMAVLAVLAAVAGIQVTRPARSAVVVVVLVGAAIGVGVREQAVVPLVLATAMPWLVTRELGHRRAIVAALAHRNRELEAEERVYAELAVQRERARIAADLHDMVSHHLAVIAVQAGAGRLEAADGARHDPQRPAAIRGAAAQALDDLDRLTDVLGAADHGGSDPMAALVAGARAAGLVVHAERMPRLPAPVGDTVRRIVQEALTNAIKHAPAAEVWIEIDLDDELGAAHVVVRDTGGRERAVLADTGSGSGLEGLRVRVAAAGGRLLAGPDGAGWRLEAEVPARPSGEVREDATVGR